MFGEQDDLVNCSVVIRKRLPWLRWGPVLLRDKSLNVSIFFIILDIIIQS